jgi:Kelch motif
VRDLWKEGHQRQLQLCHATTVSGPGVGARWLLPTESVSRDGVWDGIYLVVRSAALEPRAGTLRPARPRWGHSRGAGGGNDQKTSRNLSSDEAYDPATNRWEQRTPMPTARSGIAAAVLEGRMFVFGG